MWKTRAVKHVSFLWIGSLAGAGCAFFTQVVLARTLGPQAFGVFSSVLALTALVIPVVSFGIGQYWLKEFGEHGWDAVAFVKPSLMIVISNLVVMMAFMMIWVLWGPHDQSTRAVLLIMSAFVFGQVCVELVSSKLQLEERYEVLALWQLSPHLIRFFLVLIASVWLGNKFSVEVAATLFSGVAALIMAMCVKPLKAMTKGRILLKGHGLPIHEGMSYEKFSVLNVVKSSWPFGLAGIFHLIYFQSAIVLIKYIKGDESTAYYNVAFTIMVATLLIPGIIYEKFLLPKIHRWANHDKDLFHQIYRKGNVAMAIMGVVSMLLVWLLSPYVIHFLFGAEYAEAVELISILALSIPVLFLASSVGSALATKEHMRLRVKLMGAVAAINVVLNLLFIPRYGAQGAAVTTLLSNCALLFLYYYSASKYVFGLGRIRNEGSI